MVNDYDIEDKYEETKKLVKGHLGEIFEKTLNDRVKLSAQA